MQDFSKVLDTSSNDTKVASNQKQEIRSISPAAVVQTADVETESILPKGLQQANISLQLILLK